ncbi:hypothetical protein, partial [Escherichia coli]|uniref:hypothetical protein n=2 Tax=Escherichia coli TaxID=562 RepID=UPI0030C77E71
FYGNDDKFGEYIVGDIYKIKIIHLNSDALFFAGYMPLLSQRLFSVGPLLLFIQQIMRQARTVVRAFF